MQTMLCTPPTIRMGAEERLAGALMPDTFACPLPYSLATLWPTHFQVFFCPLVSACLYPLPISFARRSQFIHLQELSGPTQRPLATLSYNVQPSQSLMPTLYLPAPRNVNTPKQQLNDFPVLLPPPPSMLLSHLAQP